MGVRVMRLPRSPSSAGHRRLPRSPRNHCGDVPPLESRDIEGGRRKVPGTESRVLENRSGERHAATTAIVGGGTRQASSSRGPRPKGQSHFSETVLFLSLGTVPTGILTITVHKEDGGCVKSNGRILPYGSSLVLEQTELITSETHDVPVTAGGHRERPSRGIAKGHGQRESPFIACDAAKKGRSS